MKPKYDKIGNNYNRTRKADPYLVEKLYTYLQPTNNGLYLDIGCGTGNYTCELAKRKGTFIGIDPSTLMLEKAKQKNKQIDWRVGQAEKTDLATNSIHGIIASLTIHHWSSLELGFQELHRILRPDGRLVLFTATPQQMQGYWLNHYFPEMLEKSMQQMPTLANIEAATNKAGFVIQQVAPYFIQADLEDLFLYSGKHTPQLYFQAAVRNGISSFAAIAHQEEVAAGLKKLAADIETGEFEKIRQSYQNNLGDYLFLIAK